MFKLKLIVFFCFIKFVSFSQTYEYKPIINDSIVYMDAIDTRSLDLVNYYLETNFRIDEIRNKGVYVKSQKDCISVIYVLLKNGTLIERPFKYNFKTKKFEYLKILI